MKSKARKYLAGVTFAIALSIETGHSASAAAGAQGTSDKQLAGDMQSTLSSLASADKFSGAALLARGDSILFQGAYGYAERSFGVKNAVDTKFNIGSMGKMFTGVAILQLAQAGKLALDDRLSKDLPSYPNRAVAKAVTIRQLLNHTSGLSDFFGPKFVAANMNRFDSLESLLPFFVNAPLLFKPGSQWQYSNAGYIVLGLVVAHLSGESYYDYVQRHIFTPASMRDTGNWAADEVIPNRAAGYTNMGTDGAARKSNVFFLQRGGSAGGGYSTVGDLFRFAQALQDRELLNDRYTKLELSPQVATGRPGVLYGFGMEQRTINGVRIVGHSGGGPGIQGFLDIYPDLGYVVSILANYDNAASEVDHKLRLAITDAPPAQVLTLSTEDLKAVEGKYLPVVPPGLGIIPPPITITDEGNGIRVDPGMGPAFHFVPISATKFVGAEDQTLGITFTKDATGRVTALKTTGFGPVPAVTATRQP
ncbi:MAG: beta-lactamase family protein [Candidatus Eremiobacteraeota bacterium]|nr:beta-lactamase family protein [Candidatus Eremiobacteraeota bacterium]